MAAACIAEGALAVPCTGNWVGGYRREEGAFGLANHHSAAADVVHLVGTVRAACPAYSEVTFGIAGGGPVAAEVVEGLEVSEP